MTSAARKAMLERIVRYFLLAALAATPLSGCAYMTKSGRQQMAYQRYIRKCSGRREKLNKKIKAPKMPHTPGPSDNRINTEVEGPQSVTSGEAGQGQILPAGKIEGPQSVTSGQPNDGQGPPPDR